MKKFVRSAENVVGGVCGGLGNYFGVDPIFFRLAFVLGAIFGYGSPIIVYIIIWMISPEEY